MDLGLDKRVILVTGGSDGLGAALAERLLEEGASVAICARERPRLEQTAERLSRFGGRILAVSADVTRPDELERLLEDTAARFDRLDGVVNNAGSSATGTFEQLTGKEWRDDLELKLHAATGLIRMALPALRAAGNASIVNVLNVYAKAPEAGTMPTSVSRAAGLAMTKALSRELADDGIRVNGILIGFIASGQWERAAQAAGKTVEELYAKLAAEEAIPLGRVGRAEEFADLATFLLSPRASYVTGTAINLDGGLCPTV